MAFQTNIGSIEQANFRHLVYDIAWFGLALAATSRFLSVYAIRLGAGSLELGLIAALPALLVVLSTMWTSRWRSRYATSTRALTWPALAFRLMFLLPAFAPFFPTHLQPLYLVLSACLPALAQGVAAVIFLELFRGSVSPEAISPLLSKRSLWFNIALAIGAVGFGIWLERAPFPMNYVIMFVFAFGFSMLSFHHCNVVRPLMPAPQPQVERSSRSVWQLKSFRPVIMVIALSQITFTMLISIIPLYMVRERGAGEGFMALFGLVELGSAALFAFFTPALTRRIGTRSMIAVMMFGTGIGAALLVAAPTLPLTLAGAAVAGGCWSSVAMIGLFALFSEHAPADDMVTYSTVYQQVNSLAAFAGPLVGTVLVATGMGLVPVILIGALLRIVCAFVIDAPAFSRRLMRIPVVSRLT